MTTEVTVQTQHEGLVFEADQSPLPKKLDDDVKTVNMDFPVESLRVALEAIEVKNAERIQQRNRLIAEIAADDELAKTIRSRLNSSSESTRSSQGDNAKKIREFLSKIPDNHGARAVDISKGTGIPESSVLYVFKKEEGFEKNGYVYKLK